MPSKRRGEALGPGEAERRGFARCSRSSTSSAGFEIDPDQPDGPEERGDAELAIGFELRRDAVRLGPFLVRPLELAEHPRRQSRRDQRARAPDGGSAAGVGVEERGGVLAGGEVLAADVPVHPEVAAQLQARFAGSGVTVLRRGQERVERGLEVALLGDAAFERPI